MCYTYDNLGRVTARTVKNLTDDTVLSTEAFSYDAAGNITSAPDGTFEYDTNNRLVSYKGQNIIYDLDGNMCLFDDDVGEYDSANRLVYYAAHNYAYNAEDVRILNNDGVHDITYTYDVNRKLSRLLTKTVGYAETKYIYGLGLIAEDKCGEMKTYHFDSRGSTIAITDSDGNITDTYEYDTYGKMIAHTGDTYAMFGYNGRDGVITDDNGLIYMRAQYYSPELRRFINADVVAGDISDAVTLNRYAYANGNPVSFVDPFGLSVDVRMCKSSNEESDGETRYETVGLDSDENICYVYTYTYTSGVLLWKKENTGKVYIYVNVDTDFFNDPANWPAGFDKTKDLMIGDFTNDDNPNLYAYQAQNIDKKHRKYIINIMQQYDKDFDTAWNRTDESLMTEWKGHHIFSFASARAQNIDFDNAEENYKLRDYYKKGISAGFDMIADKVKGFFDKIKSKF